ncbi:MAG: hypothetical protein R6V39_03235 [Desulfovibrionales bacterium]
MARITRVVAPGYPHHITQRGNRQQQTFFSDEAYLLACARNIELNQVRAKLLETPKA